MAKKKAPGVPNRHVYSRISFLYQAASYLSTSAAKQDASSSQTDTEQASVAAQNLSRKMITDLRAVTLKSQVRISPALKRTICKYCDTLLVEGQTCSSSVENKSKGGKKPWADVLVIKCHTCGRAKRFPVSAERQKRRPQRASTDTKVADSKRPDIKMEDQGMRQSAVDEHGSGT